MSDLVKAVAGVLAGGIVGWSANALTLVGRVDAIEKSQARVEARVELLIQRIEQQPRLDFGNPPKPIQPRS